MAYNKVEYGGNVIIDLTEDTIDSASLLSGKTAHGADGEIINGAMPERGAVSGTIATKTGKYTVPAGHHDGKGTVQISSTEQAKIIAGNIKAGVTILGVAGSYSGDGVQTEEKEITPTTGQQVITPTAGKYISKVTVKAIPYAEESNTAGGTTVKIG